jgi:hypothetical protein
MRKVLEIQGFTVPGLIHHHGSLWFRYKEHTGTVLNDRIAL